MSIFQLKQVVIIILFFSLISITLLLFIAMVVHKDLLSPAVVINIPWLISLIFLIPSDFFYETNSIHFLYFVIGIILFNIGYFFTVIGKKNKRLKENKWIIKNINYKVINLIVIFELIILSIYLFTLLIYVNGNFNENIYFTLKMARGTSDLVLMNFMDYLNNFIISFTMLILYLYLQNRSKKNSILLTMQLIIGTISVFLTLGRTAILLYCILIFVTFVIYSNFGNRKILKYVTILGSLSIIFFSIYNLVKYPYLLESYSALEISLEYFILYISGSMVTIQQWMASNTEFLYGENTFRFIIAVLNTVGYDLNLQPLTNSFVSIGNKTTSNVYTFYHYYVVDFGWLYAFLAQFSVGLLHGFLYKKMTFKDPFWVFLFSLSLYPLFMQFFQDQYLSLTSTWVQFVFYGILLFKSNIFIRSRNSSAPN